VQKATRIFRKTYQNPIWLLLQGMTTQLAMPDGADIARNMTPVTRPLTGADIMRALETEIRAAYRSKGGVKAFSTELGVNPGVYRRYLTNERSMSAEMLMNSLELLGVDPVEFFMQLRATHEAAAWYQSARTQD